MTDPRPISVQPYFGGFVLETLTVGMYGESRNAIREYIQNSFDSIQNAIERNLIKAGSGLITVSYDSDLDGLKIRDNGAGLPTSHASQTLTSIGASRKDFRTDAGFRGIGRLAGVTFSDTVTFTTKAVQEKEATKVVIDAKEMRRLMSPEHGNEVTAEQLLKRCVSASLIDAPAEAPAFFEVSLRGFTEAPDVCTSSDEMRIFLSQIAPVDYAEGFPFRKDIDKYARQAGIPIESVRIQIEPPDGGETIEVRKPYGAQYEVQDAGAHVPLNEIEAFFSETKKWWGWVGKKAVPGSYLEAQVRGIRVRAKNIQIDGTDVVREIFQRLAKSNERYQSWFVGEIFVDLKSVVPNARRDGFEENKAWTDMRQEIFLSICKEAGAWAQAVSNLGQLTLDKLTEKSGRIQSDLEALRRTDFKSTDRTIGLSASVTKLQSEIARAAKNADPPTLAALQHLGSQLVDIKTEAITKIAPPAAGISDSDEQDMQDRLLAELLTLFESRLELPCLAAVRNIIREEYDWPRG